MPVKTLDPSEIDGIEYLVKRTFDYLKHPDVVEAVPGAPVTRRKLDAVWSLVWTHLQQHRGRPAPSAALAGKLSWAAQEAADLLSSPAVRQIHFALPAANVARELREVVRRMKSFRR
jgi:hypothetical protein